MNQGGALPWPSGQDNQQQPQQPQQQQQPVIPSVSPQTVPPVTMAMNQSYFKPELQVKPEKDLEAYILRTIDCMDTHNFAAGQTVQRFPLTLAGEARLWYQSIPPFQGNLEDLQERFRAQFSKISNAREQLFHAQRSFHFDENEETIDAYVQRIRQVAAMLNYDEPQILEVFKT